MNHRISTVLAGAILAWGGAAHAATFTPDFSDYSFPGTQYTVDAAANAFFATTYGIDITNSYLYKDSRDTFDGIGISNGTVAEIYTPQAGRIAFLDLTDFVTINYLALQESVYSAYDSHGVLLDTFSASGGTGTHTLHSVGTDYISSLTFSGVGGFTDISDLTYNFDGRTGGGNTDLPNAIPEPETYALMLGGLVLLAAVNRKRKATSIGLVRSV